MNFDQFQEISSTSRIFEFAQSNLTLQGAIIQNQTIEGSFGTAQIHSSRNQQILILQNLSQYSLFNNIQRAIITKSNKVKSKQKQNAKKQFENEGKQSEEMIQKQQSQDKSVSQSSAHIKVRSKNKKNRGLRRKQVRKSLMNRITKLKTHTK